MDGVEWFDFSSENYFTEEVTNVDNNMDKNNFRVTSKYNTKFQVSHIPEWDVTVDMKDDGVYYYKELIRVIRLSMELGRV